MNSLYWFGFAILLLIAAAVCVVKIESLTGAVICGLAAGGAFLWGALVNHREHVRR